MIMFHPVIKKLLTIFTGKSDLPPVLLAMKGGFRVG